MPEISADEWEKFKAALIHTLGLYCDSIYHDKVSMAEGVVDFVDNWKRSK